jgi:hypothetical protein
MKRASPKKGRPGPKGSASKKRSPKKNPIDAKVDYGMQKAAEALVDVLEKRGRGQPTKYQSEYVHLARKMCKLGATDQDLAEAFKVTTPTIWAWSCTHEDFFNALQEGKNAFDARVERALAQRAIGYSYTTEKVFNYQGEIVRADTVEHVPPDPGAAKLWLCNRKPEQWQDSKRHEHSGPQGGPIQVEHEMTDIDLARRIAFIFGEAMSARPALELTADDAPESDT